MAAVGTTTYSEETFGSIKKIGVAWISHTDGTVSGTLTTGVYSGEIMRLVTVPGTGDNAPDSYGITLLYEDGTDVLMGAGAGRSTSNTEQVLASSLGCVANDKLELRISGAGSANKGTAYIYIR